MMCLVFGVFMSLVGYSFLCPPSHVIVLGDLEEYEQMVIKTLRIPFVRLFIPCPTTVKGFMSYNWLILYC